MAAHVGDPQRRRIANQFPSTPRPVGNGPISRRVASSIPRVRNRPSCIRDASNMPNAAYRAPVTSRAAASARSRTTSTSSPPGHSERHPAPEPNVFDARGLRGGRRLPRLPRPVRRTPTVGFHMRSVVGASRRIGLRRARARPQPRREADPQRPHRSSLFLSMRPSVGLARQVREICATRHMSTIEVHHRVVREHSRGALSNGTPARRQL